jgi:flagellar biosynthesis protein FlhB
VPDDTKTEQPTPRRRQRAREKGQVARSRELAAGIATAAAVAVTAWQISSFGSQWRGMFRATLSAAQTGELSWETAGLGWKSVSIFGGTALALGLSWMLAVLASIGQGGLVFAPSSLQFRIERISPAARLRQLFSITALGNLLKSLLPVAAIVYFCCAILARDWATILRLPYRSGGAILVFTLQHLFEAGWKSTLVLLIWSGADYFFQKMKFEHDLRMSRQELRDELKETDGHPTIKARIRRLQRQVRRRRMLQDVKRAAVVITNPTQFAVALEYGAQMAAPVVVAKGRNLLAQEIKQIARWHEIPVLENPPLAHALYRAVEVGQSIPPKLYAVVAEVLAMIFRAQKRAQQARGVA